ncbi:hypothetical protein EYF80_029347 [Liparis tanakae]|uniref:Uncharacterized protein n=1 Tax=Liparis tanakae TaxID=230148 RepID=A0A4Z2H3W7_9TELE|nr:hypothetical protein EYF80_029347 [Liparis tanakae]
MLFIPSQSRSQPSHLGAGALRLGGEPRGVLLAALHAHQLHLRLREAEHEAAQQVRDGERVGQRQAHQACSRNTHASNTTAAHAAGGAARLAAAADSPGSTAPYRCWTTASAPRPVTTATPISCSRMLSHCMAALLRKRQRCVRWI